MKIHEIFSSYARREHPDIIWLLSAILNLSRSDILLGTQRALSKKETAAFLRAWRRRRAGEPLQYIVGKAPFFGRDFFVNKNVLIPRPETETLVELCLESMRAERAPKILDIGTGSGAIAATIKLERPEAEVSATDISRAALLVARKNAKIFSAAINFQYADLAPAKFLKEKWDLWVSNPPYLSFAKDKIANDVKKWEPRMALEPGKAQKVAGRKDRAFWVADRIFFLALASRPKRLFMELSPRVASALEKKWKRSQAIESIERVADLAGRKRFLLVVWKDG